MRTQLVKRCGTRVYWDEWADDVARIAQRHIERIGELVRSDTEVSVRFATFLQGLRDSLNPHVSEGDAVEMVAQHMITVPVFDALFGDFEFASSNPVSVAINGFLESLKGRGIEEASDAEVLEDVYASVRRRAACIQSDTARQQLIRDLYERFFKVAFKGTSDKMGVVYTPTEIIDYILRQTDRVLRREFGKGLADDGVHILDPFAGTGAFMAHLIESDLIPADKLGRKYAKELHSNEILLLAYYIMTVNVEQAYHARVGGDYVPFEGAVLTDTFQMTEDGNTLDDEVFTDNSDRVRIQNALPIRVIVGNPPYSVGQKSANDNNQNDSYPTLDARIAATYVAKTDATNKNSLYDSYIRAFRWASDRVGEQGVVAFVSNGGWIRGNAFNGFRSCLHEEFDDVYVFDLRGNQRTMGEESRREGGKVFGQGSRAPVAVTILVKKKGGERAGRIHYHDVGDYMSREDKLSAMRETAQTGEVDWREIVPDGHGDWMDQRDDSFANFIPLGIEKMKPPMGMSSIWSRGFSTARDAWIYSFGKEAVLSQMKRLLFVYEQERARYECAAGAPKVDGFVERDEKKIKWNRGLLDHVKKGTVIRFNRSLAIPAMYRPFCKQWLYCEYKCIDMPYQQPRLFPLAISEGKRPTGPTSNPCLSLALRKKAGSTCPTSKAFSNAFPTW